MARRIEKTPACIEMRVPQTTREKVSRPRSSVPNGCASVGAFRIFCQSACSGSTVAVVSGVTGRALDADTGIEKRVGHVHQEVDQHVGAGREEHDPLHEGIVPREHRLDDQSAEPGHDEDLLGDDGAAHERAHLQPEDGDHRDEAVADRVAEHHHAASAAPSTNAGMSMRWRLASGLSQSGTNPEAGNHPSRTEKNRINMIPSQKLGMDTPQSDPLLARTSQSVLRRTAARTPVGIAMPTAMSNDRNASSIVIGSFVATVLTTDSCVRME